MDSVCAMSHYYFFEELQASFIVEKQGWHLPRAVLGVEVCVDILFEIELDGGGANVDDVRIGNGSGHFAQPRGARHTNWQGSRVCRHSHTALVQ